MEKATPSSRGRPKVLDRDYVLSVALEQYWLHGPTQISINDICNLSGASKPGVYREFGSDDGLKSQALMAYKIVAIDPFLGLLKNNHSLAKTSKALVEFILQDRQLLKIPNGCLFVTMRSQRHCFGPITKACIDRVRSDFFSSFVNWIKLSKSKGEFRLDIPTKSAAHQIEALHMGAANMQKENASNEDVRNLLIFGLSAISGEDQILW